MTRKLSSSTLLAGVIGLFVMLLFAMLIYAIKSYNSRYHDYRLNAIMSSPYESFAKVTNKSDIGSGFEIEYEFKGKPYGEVMNVQKDLYKKYKEGDKVPITISSNQPSLVTLTSELKDYQQRTR